MFLQRKPCRSRIVPTSTAHRNRAAALSHPTARLPIDDTRIREIKELAPPSHLLREFPVSEKTSVVTYDSRQAIHRMRPGMLCTPIGSPNTRSTAPTAV